MNNSQGKKPASSADKLKKLNNQSDKSDTIKREKRSKRNKTVQERIKKQKKKFLEIFRENIAIITASCLKAKISRETFYNWYKNDKEFAKQVEEIRSEQLGSVEDRLMKAILNDNLGAIIFYLKSKHPEYKPKQSIDFGDKEKIEETSNFFKKLINVAKKDIKKSKIIDKDIQR